MIDEEETIETTKLEIITADGSRISAAYFSRPQKPARRAVLISGATAVPKHFYANFARFLASGDCAVLTFDYRGTGESTPENGLNGFSASLIDWGSFDIPANLNWLAERHPNLPLHFIGHSAGAQLIGLIPDQNKLKSALMVSASSGYVPQLRLASQIKALFFFKVYAPICARLFGYVPGKQIGLGEDLPAGVAKQWGKWCLNPGYVENSFGKEISSHYYNEVSLPILALTPTDDQIATPANVDDFMRLLPNAKIKHVKLVPEEYSLKSIDHLNFFRRQSRVLWSQALEWFVNNETSS